MLHDREPIRGELKEFYPIEIRSRDKTPGELYPGEDMPSYWGIFHKEIQSSGVLIGNVCGKGAI
jgi:hypothetical protein